MRKTVPASDPSAYVAALTGWQRTLVEKLRMAVRTAGALDETIKWGGKYEMANTELREGERVNSAAVPTVIRQRVTYIALALGTIVIGLLVHLRGTMLGPTVRDILGDALWASMIVWWIGALMPLARPLTRYGVAYAICALVELSQAYQTPALDAIRATTIGQLVLGSGFDPRDFVAYALGVSAAALVDMAARRRR